MLRALSFLAWFVEHSFSFSDSSILPFEPYNDDEYSGRPTRLKLWFPAPESSKTQAVQNGEWRMYGYELEISNGWAQRVRHEAVHIWPSASGRRTRLFERSEDGTVKASKTFDLGPEKAVLQRILKPNASVISTLAQLNHGCSSELVKLARSVRSNILDMKHDPPDHLVLQKYMEQPELVKRLNREISRVDVGIHAFEVSGSPEGPNVMLRHEGLSRPMPFHVESHGTQQFIRHFPYLDYVLTDGGVAVIDELDLSMHPAMMSEILRWFRDPERNPHNAQLWMSCQSPSLLEDLQKDEIAFCEKDAKGRTAIFALNDVKAVRRDDNFYRKYMGGQYGALPLIG